MVRRCPLNAQCQKSQQGHEYRPALPGGLRLPYSLSLANGRRSQNMLCTSSRSSRAAGEGASLVGATWPKVSVCRGGFGTAPGEKNTGHKFITASRGEKGKKSATRLKHKQDSSPDRGIAGNIDSGGKIRCGGSRPRERAATPAGQSATCLSPAVPHPARTAP